MSHIKVFHELDNDKVYHLWATTFMHMALIAQRLGTDPSRISKIITEGRAANNPQVLKGDEHRKKEGVNKFSRY